MNKLERRQKAVEKARFEKMFWRRIAENHLSDRDKQKCYELLKEELIKNGFEE